MNIDFVPTDVIHSVYAQWTAKTYTVTFDANGGSDGYLAGQYNGEWEDVWAGEWFYVPFNEPVTLEANNN